MAKNKQKEEINTPEAEKTPEVLTSKKVVSVEVIGSLYDGVKYLIGIIELEEKEAESLINSGHVKRVDE